MCKLGLIWLNLDQQKCNMSGKQTDVASQQIGQTNELRYIGDL